MKYLIHGDDLVASRKEMIELIRGLESIVIDGKNASLRSVEESLLSQDLFADKKAVIIENLSKSAAKKEIILFINSIEANDLILIWENKKQTKIYTGKFKNFVVYEYSYPSYFFEFLDGIFPKNARKVFLLFQKLQKSYASELILFSLQKRIRILFTILNKQKSNEILKMPEWMLARLSKQASMWSKKDLGEFYLSLQELEISQKTGRLPIGLTKHLDILILSKL